MNETFLILKYGSKDAAALDYLINLPYASNAIPNGWTEGGVKAVYQFLRRIWINNIVYGMTSPAMKEMEFLAAGGHGWQAEFLWLEEIVEDE